jgi:hypothetical protein
VLSRVLEDQTNCPLSHLRCVLLWSRHDPNLSSVGVSDKHGAVQIASVVPVSTSAGDLVRNLQSTPGQVCVDHWDAGEDGLFPYEEYYCEIVGCEDNVQTVLCTAYCYGDASRTQYWDGITASVPPS